MKHKAHTKKHWSISTQYQKEHGHRDFLGMFMAVVQLLPKSKQDYEQNFQIMGTENYMVAEMQLTYRNPQPPDKRTRIENTTQAYQVLRSFYPDETI